MRWLGGTQNADPCVFHPQTYIPGEFVTQLKWEPAGRIGFDVLL